MINGESEIIKDIASNVKEWAGDWDAIWENITLRSEIKQAIVDFARIHKDSDYLEADFAIRANDEFHKISDKIYGKYGKLDNKRIFFDWNEWLKTEARRVKKRG